MTSYCFGDTSINVEEWDEYTGCDQWNAVYTIQIGELLDCGVFDWSREVLDWSSAAYDVEQYERVCKYFIERFYYREISIEPFEEWARTVKRKLVYELMPRFRILYAEAKKEWDIKTGGKKYGSYNTETMSTNNENGKTIENGKNDEYYKGRVINSEYPETLLSANSDYVSDGKDTEDERVTENERTSENNQTGESNSSKTHSYEDFSDANTRDYVEQAELYANLFGSIDRRLLDGLESMFISMYTTNINSTW